MRGARRSRLRPPALRTASLPALQDVLGSHRITLDGGFAIVYGKDQRVLASFQAPPESSPASLVPWLEEGERGSAIPLHGPLSASLLTSAQRSDEPVIEVAGQEYALGMSATASGKVVVTALPMPQGLSQTAMRIRSGSAAYWELFRTRNQIRTMFFLMLLLITVLVFFFSVWMALFLSRQITRPVEALAVAMAEIATGKYDHRVALAATGEMGELVRAFNHMAADLDASRQLAETSSAQLTAANLAIEERRRELETIVETIPSGVVTLDGAGTVLQSNRAFAALLGRRVDVGLGGEKIESLFPAECAEDLAGVIRRGHRMGAAFTEIEFHGRGRILHLAITSARFELTQRAAGNRAGGGGHDGTAARAAAVGVEGGGAAGGPRDQESADPHRALRRADRPASGPRPAGLARRHPQVQRGDSGLRGHAAHAGGPVLRAGRVSRAAAARLRHESSGGGGAGAVCRPAGRHHGASATWSRACRRCWPIRRPSAARWPTSSTTPPRPCRAACCACSAFKARSARTARAVEVVVSDTGHGLTDEIRERLFLPFYSTKQRGTGLGLSIAAKIVQEHGGSLRAEANSPKGARFLLRLPLMEPVPEPSAEPAAAAMPRFA